MITYVYSAKQLSTGEIISAEVQAESESAAAKLLIDQKLFPISIKSKSEAGLNNLKFLNKIKAKDRVIFTRQLATLINAGLPLTQSLRTGRDQITSKPLRAVLEKIIAAVEGGASLASAFAEHPEVFDSIYVSLISAGEATGTLDTSLERIALQQEKDAAIASKIKSALIYPMVVLFVIAAVLIFMITAVLPQISKFYKDQHKALPPATEFLDVISQFLIHQWYIAIVVTIGMVWGLRAYFKTEKGTEVLDNFKMEVPAFGMIFRKIYMARFARTLGTMLKSGIPMLQALEIVEKGVGNVHVAKTIRNSIERVKGGKSLSSTLENQPSFLPLVGQMVLIGEQSGALDTMLERIATYYEDEVDTSVKNLSTLIEPLLMVVMGVTIGGVIAAILLPIYSLVGGGNIK